MNFPEVYYHIITNYPRGSVLWEHCVIDACIHVHLPGKNELSIGQRGMSTYRRRWYGKMRLIRRDYDSGKLDWSIGKYSDDDIQMIYNKLVAIANLTEF